MADFAVRFNDFSGGDWGDTDPAKAKVNQFSGRNVVVYGDGLLGVRPGWKVLDPTGRAVGWPASYTGAVRGFDVMGNKLTIATIDKTYDLYWDLNLAPGGTLPANNPIPLPGGLATTDQVQFLRGADTAMKDFALAGGKLYYRTGDPNGAWTLTGPAGKNLSTITRWNLYLVAVDKDQPWIVWFSQVDAAGPSFLTWPANNFLFVGTTETVTTLLSIFNMLYAGRASGWWGISGVLGTLASVRELAIGNGPLDQRMASVTTDNRIAYWPMQKVPAFWNGERVQLVDNQRMDPRQQWLSTTPGFSKGGSAGPDAYKAKYTGDTLAGGSTAQDDGQNGILILDNPLRGVGTAWAATGAKALGAATLLAAYWGGFGTMTATVPPGWSRVLFSAFSTAPIAWSSPDGVPSEAAPVGRFSPAADVRCHIRAVAAGEGGVDPNYDRLPPGAALRLMVNGVELCRTVYSGSNTLILHAVTLIRATDVVSVEIYNPTADPMRVAGVQPAGGAGTVAADLAGRPAPVLHIMTEPACAASYGWVCPTTGRYDIHADIHSTMPIVNNQGVTGAMWAWFQFNKNGIPFATRYVSQFYGPDADVAFDATDVALTAGDELTLSYASPYRSSGGYGSGTTPVGVGTAYIAGPEGVTRPMMKVTDRATREIFGTLAIPGDAVVVTPTERRLMFLGDDGSTSKIWSYAETIWTHHTVPMLLGGMAPADVRGAYQLPEHVVFATKRNYTAEPLRVWSIAHDIDRPALVSDRWASPYDQSMPTDVFVRGEASLPRWFDGQGRQCRVRSVIVQFRKWDQGVVGATNKITARVDACGPYEGGVQAGVEATWEEPMTGASPAGTDDSWRFNVGEQGFANGFQVVFTGLYGVAIREVVVTVDVRTERT